jgi:hypothetical protein
VLPLNLDRGIANVTVRVADRDVSADIDTGSMGALTVPMALAKDLPLAGPPAEAGRARTVTNEFVVYEAALNASAFLGSHELPRPTLQFSEIFPRANVGMQVLRDFAVTIDQRHGRIAFDRGQATPAATPSPAAPPRRIGLAFVPDAGGLRVQEVVPNLPGAKAGVRPGDLLVAIDGRSALDIPQAEMGAALVGRDPVTLTIRRGADTLSIVVRYGSGSRHPVDSGAGRPARPEQPPRLKVAGHRNPPDDLIPEMPVDLDVDRVLRGQRHA